MLYWLIQQKSLLLKIPVEVLLETLLLWALLNRLAPPRLVIVDPAEGEAERGGKPVLRRLRQFPLGKCTICALLLSVVLAVAMTPIMLFQILGLVAGPVMLMGVGVWFFGSRWAVSIVFEGCPPGQQSVIVLIFFAISVGVEALLHWGMKLIVGA